MNITEEERKEFLSKYDEKTSNELLNYLKRKFPVSEFKFDWQEKPIKQIYIDDKLYRIEGNKKYLVNKLSDIIENEWIHLDRDYLRRTVKKFIDGNLLWTEKY